MFSIVKKVLTDIPAVYAVGQVAVDGRDYFLAASENRDGPAYLISAADGVSYKLWDGPGGVMTVMGAKDEAAVLSIEEFYPVFDSAAAKIMKTELWLEQGELRTKRRKLCDLPYVHRIALAQEEDGCFLVAGTLCTHKDFVEDWSTAGNVYAGRYGKEEQTVELSVIKESITKQHAMYVRPNEAGYDDVYVGGSEGIFRCSRQNRSWKAEKVLEAEVSDICVEDIDGDGEEEIVIIEGFHGDMLSIFKQEKGGYRKAAQYPIRFGHVLWSGRVCGKMAVITGCRGGDKELCVNLVELVDGSVKLKAQTIEKGVGATQINVCTLNNTTFILSSNHAQGQVCIYELREE